METRALCIAFFYAIGTAVGGISGPLLFGWLIDNASASKDITGIAIGYFIGAALMIGGGIVEAFLGVKAEGQSLESIAQPLTAEDSHGAGPRGPARRPQRRLTAATREDTAMPMPPPKPSTEGTRDRQVFHEMGQIVRALEAHGACTPDELAAQVGRGVLGAAPVRPGARVRGHATGWSRAAPTGSCARSEPGQPKIRTAPTAAGSRPGSSHQDTGRCWWMSSAASKAISPNAAAITSRPIWESVRFEKYAATTSPAERCRMVSAVRVDITQRWTDVKLIESRCAGRGCPGTIRCLRTAGGRDWPEDMSGA